MIVKNPGRKATAKLMLNSFWGKFGQNCNKSKVHQITHPASLLNLIDDPMEQIQDIRDLSPELVEVVAKRDDQDPEKGRATNVFIAALPPARPALNCTSRWKFGKIESCTTIPTLWYTNGNRVNQKLRWGIIWGTWQMSWTKVTTSQSLSQLVQRIMAMSLRKGNHA